MSLASGAQAWVAAARRLSVLPGLLLAVGCAAQNHAVTSEIPVSAEAPSSHQPEATDGRQLPPSGAWWLKPDPCPEGARVRTLQAEAGEASGGGYRCELATGVPHGAVSVWWPNGKLREDGQHERGAKHGVWSSYSESGELLARETYRADALSGRVQRYAVGVLVEDASYLDGQLSGVRLKYYPDGKLEERETYSAGVLSGEFESRNADGSLAARGAYKSGEQHGEWEICDDDECTRAHFEAGAQAGIWETRDRAGVMLRTEDYSVPDQLTRIDYCQGRPCKRTVFVRR